MCVEFSPRVRVRFVRYENAAKSSSSSSSVDMAQLTLETDSYATSHLGLLFLPISIGFCLYSLIYSQHKSWYSYLLSSLTGCIYTFGFILMVPQLLINYRLKSVEHMPWANLSYRFLNTIIDDLFAFVIRMPMMHRISCFRDDLIFVVYLYQRYTYPVDASRRVVAREEGEEEVAVQQEEVTDVAANNDEKED